MARGYAYFVSKNTGEVTAAGKPDLHRNLSDTFFTHIQQCLGLLYPVPVEVGNWREPYFLMKTTRQVTLAQPHMGRHITTRNRFHIMCMDIGHRLQSNMLGF